MQPGIELDENELIQYVEIPPNSELGDYAFPCFRLAKELKNAPADIAYYIKENGKLPDNFITKSEARALGWDANKGNLAEVAPGKSIGGDVFNNNEGLLPKKSGRIYYECDINYVSGFRGADRLIFSNDGLIFKTVDHYQTFTEIN